MATPIPKNRCAFTLGEAAAAAGGRLGGDGSIATSSVSIDTRTLEPGALFVALKGAGADGHAFLDDALRRGAAGAVVAAGRAHPALPCIEVADTLDALGRLAHRHLDRTRQARRIPSIAIGGATGKTTTKELCAAAARALFGPTLATPGNLNNLIGVPMTLFILADEHRAIVIECGTNQRGEIARLAAIVEPDVAMVLNVDIEHSEFLGSLEEIADEETALFAGARARAVACIEEPLVTKRIPGGLRTVTFGTSPPAGVRLVDRTMVAPGRSRVSIKLDPALVQAGESPLAVFEIGLLGAAAALNCAAAIAGVAAMNPAPLRAADLNAIGAALGAVPAVARRLCPRTIRGIFVIDDSYNSSPRAVRAALAAAREVADATHARLVVVLGDMLELGALTAAAHADAVREACATAPARFVAVGPQMSAALRAMRNPGGDGAVETSAARDSAEAAPLVRDLVRPGDVLLVKGSLGMQMDRVIDALCA